MSTLAFDTETRGLEWFDPDHRAFLISWSDETGDYHCDATDILGVNEFLRKVHTADRLVAHNLPFDVLHLRALGIDILSYDKDVVDTDILARVVVPERRGIDDSNAAEDRPSGRFGFKLKDLGLTYVDPNGKDSEDAIKELAKKHGIKLKSTGGYYQTWLAEPKAMEQYARDDTRLTLGLLPHLEAKVTSRNRAVWDLERDVQKHLIAATHRGVRVDQDKVVALHAKYEAQRDAAYAALEAELPGIFSPPDSDEPESPDVLREALLAYGIPLTRMTKSNKSLSTDKFALQEHEPHFPILKTLADYRQAKKFLSTYTGAMLGRDVVHPTFWQIGAWTGRMSCSRPNMQNVPVRGEGAAELRSMFIPREGYCFVVSDFDSIELRLLAYYLNGEEFIQKVERGDDVFAELAANLAVVRGYVDELGRDASGYLKGTPGASKRSDSKNTTYAITYGAGKKRISDMLDLDPVGVVNGVGGLYPEDHRMVLKGYVEAGTPMYEPANQVIKMVKGWLPNYFKLTKRIRTKVETVEHVNTLLGRKQPVGADKSYVGLNAIIQGSAADLFKLAITATAEAVQHLGAIPVLFVHDEIVTECPIEHAEECLRLQDAAMASVSNIRPALAVSGSIAYNDYSEGK